MNRLLVCLAAIAAVGCASDPVPETSAAIDNFATTPDGVRLYYRSIGEGDDVVIAPFALYHGSSLDALADGRRIVTYDPRGRGKSAPAPKGALSLDHLLIDFETVRQATGAEKVSIIGWSGAGMEMFVYTLRNKERVKALVQLAPVTARFDPFGGMMMEDRARRTDKAKEADYKRRVDVGEFANDATAQCRAEAAITLPPLLADAADLSLIPDVCVFENEHPDRIGAYFGELFGSIIGYDWRDELSEVDARRLVIHGAKDNMPLDGNREWVAGQPNARLLVIEDAGHFPHYEQPNETLGAIDAFLDGGWPAGVIAQ
jgi:proline iminopeptidase